jgi:hypothetical protein
MRGGAAPFPVTSHSTRRRSGIANAKISLLGVHEQQLSGAGPYSRQGGLRHERGAQRARCNHSQVLLRAIRIKAYTQPRVLYVDDPKVWDASKHAHGRVGEMSFQGREVNSHFRCS